MNWTKLVWVGGIAVVSSIVDLGYLFWSRSQSGQNFGKAAWKSAGFGKGHYSLTSFIPKVPYKGGWHK